jgi:hypothetical protein
VKSVSSIAASRRVGTVTVRGSLHAGGGGSRGLGLDLAVRIAALGARSGVAQQLHVTLAESTGTGTGTGTEQGVLKNASRFSAPCSW